MNQLQNFIRILSGRFNNAQQLHALQAEGVTDFPYAEHVNTPCNDKITGLPSDFPGVFLVEESYYTIGGRTNASPHLFLFTEEADGAVKLTSYDLPDGCSKTDFTYQTMPQTDYAALRPSAKFTPALYRRSNGVWPDRIIWVSENSIPNESRKSGRNIRDCRKKKSGNWRKARERNSG